MNVWPTARKRWKNRWRRAITNTIGFLSFVIFIASLSTNVVAQQWLEGPFRAKLIRVIDGEHIEALTSLPNGSRQNFTVKLLGIDAPELNGKCPQKRELAKKTQARLAQILGKNPILSNIQTTEKKGYIYAQVLMLNEKDPIHRLVLENLARPY